MDLERNVEGFFHDEVDRAFRDEGLKPGTLVEHYIVQLLAAYAAQPHRGHAARAADAGGDRGPAAASAGASCARSATRRCTCRGSGASTWPAARSTSTTTSGWAAPPTASWRAGGPGWTGDPFSDVFERAGGRTSCASCGALALVSRRMAIPASNQDVVRLYRPLAGDEERARRRPGWPRWAWSSAAKATGGRNDGCRHRARRGCPCWRGCSWVWRRSIAWRRACPSTRS